MLAMQYSFTLPSDYDMSVIRERIASKGHLMDDFPLLVFKAFLYARRDQGRRHACENLYAPFYLWESAEGMNRFLGSNGFAALTGSFGWPSIKTWSVWEVATADDTCYGGLRNARDHADSAPYRTRRPTENRN